MRLVVRQNDRVVSEFRFAKGPVYIGRHTNSQIFLPDNTVSRQHAVLFKTHEGKWIAEDLDSANKTYLNDKPIHKAEVEHGDYLRISDFTIEIGLEEDDDEKPINLEDTLTTSSRGPQVIVRKIGIEHAPPMKLPAKRTNDFLQATEQICQSNGLEQLLLALLSIAMRQFRAFHVWCALRSKSTGPMTCHAGRKQDGSAVELSEIELQEKITEGFEKTKFMLLPRLPFQMEQKKLRSAMIAPIMSTAGCFGVIYVGNSTNHEHYSLADLDYLLLLTIHTAAILKNF